MSKSAPMAEGTSVTGPLNIIFRIYATVWRIRQGVMALANQKFAIVSAPVSGEYLT